MAGLTTIRRAIATAATVALGEWTWAYAPDMAPPNIGPRGALIVLVDPTDTVIERATFARTFRYRLRARVIVGGASERERQERLDALVSPDGPESLWPAIDAIPTDGEIDYVQVLSVTNYGQLDGQPDGVVTLAADLVIEAMESHL